MTNIAQDYKVAFENLKEKKSVLQPRLDDQETRDRRSNLRIRGIPETVLDLQATMITLFQKLQPGIPVKRL